MSKIETNTIAPSTGTTLTLGESGDTVQVGTGVTATGFGANTPAFKAYISSGQSISNTTMTKVTFQTEMYDTDNAYDNSTNYRFTPQEAGKYFVYASIYLDAGTNTNLDRCYSYIYKNSTQVFFNVFDPRANSGRGFSTNPSGIISLNGSTDYVEVKSLIVGTSNAFSLVVYGGTGNNASFSYFGAYKIIE